MTLPPVVLWPLPEHSSDGEWKVRQDSPVHHHTTGGSLQSSSSLSKPPCSLHLQSLVQPSACHRKKPYLPNSGESLGLRIGEHILASQFNMPSSFSLCHDLVCTCSLSWHPSSPHQYTLWLSNEHYQIYFCEVYLTKPHKKSNTTKMASGNCVSADKHRYLTKVLDIEELNDQLPGLDSTFLTHEAKTLWTFLTALSYCWFSPRSESGKTPSHPLYGHYFLSFIIWPCLPLPQWPSPCRLQSDSKTTCESLDTTLVPLLSCLTQWTLWVSWRPLMSEQCVNVIPSTKLPRQPVSHFLLFYFWTMYTWYSMCSEWTFIYVSSSPMDYRSFHGKI